MLSGNKCDVRDFLIRYGEYFRSQRKKCELTQLQVANAIGISQAIISHIEQGYMLPPQEIEDSLIELLEYGKEV